MLNAWDRAWAWIGRRAAFAGAEGLVVDIGSLAVAIEMGLVAAGYPWRLLSGVVLAAS